MLPSVLMLISMFSRYYAMPRDAIICMMPLPLCDIYLLFDFSCGDAMRAAIVRRYFSLMLPFSPPLPLPPTPLLTLISPPWRRFYFAAADCPPPCQLPATPLIPPLPFSP
jgi:hypothetical protein